MQRQDQMLHFPSSDPGNQTIRVRGSQSQLKFIRLLTLAPKISFNNSISVSRCTFVERTSSYGVPKSKERNAYVASSVQRNEKKKKMDKKYHITLPPLCQACVKFRVKVGKGAMYRCIRLLYRIKKKKEERWIADGGRILQAHRARYTCIPQTSTSQLILRRNLLRVIVTLVIVVDILLQVVVGVGLLKVLAEGSISRVSYTSRCYTIKRLVII